MYKFAKNGLGTGWAFELHINIYIYKFKCKFEILFQGETTGIFFCLFEYSFTKVLLFLSQHGLQIGSDIWLIIKE